MKIQVIINNYNYSDYIEEAIVSVLNQSYSNYDLFIVDDGSTDNSREIIERYYRKYPEKIYPIYKENGGQGSAFNAAFQYSNGYDIITFLDADDYLFPNKLAEIVKYHRDYDLVEHSLETSLNYCLLKEEKNNMQYRLLKHRKFLSFMPTSGLSYKKEILDKIFPIPEEKVKICADTYLNIFAIYHGAKIKTLKECLGFYRIHEKNSWVNNQSKYKSIFNDFIEVINMQLLQKNLNTIPTFEESVETQLNYYNLNRKIAIYGTGDFSKKVTNILKDKNIEIECYVETNMPKEEVFLGKPVLSISHLLNNGVYSTEMLIIIANSFKQEVLHIIKKLGLKNKILTFDI